MCISDRRNREESDCYLIGSTQWLLKWLLRMCTCSSFTCRTCQMNLMATEKFSNGKLLLNWLYEMTIKLTFENMCQFIICMSDMSDELDGNYAAFGKVYTCVTCDIHSDMTGLGHVMSDAWRFSSYNTATHCNTLQHTATRSQVVSCHYVCHTCVCCVRRDTLHTWRWLVHVWLSHVTWLSHIRILMATTPRLVSCTHVWHIAFICDDDLFVCHWVMARADESNI